MVLAEVVALRTILLNLHFALATGDTPTADAMQRLIERADQDKIRKAQERLASSPGRGIHDHETWGRVLTAGTWPHPKPVWTLAVCLVALASGGAIAAYRDHTVWTPLQRMYAPTLLRCQLMAVLGFTTTGRYRLLEVEGSTGRGWRSKTRCSQCATERHRSRSPKRPCASAAGASCGATPRTPTRRSTRS